MRRKNAWTSGSGVRSVIFCHRRTASARFGDMAFTIRGGAGAGAGSGIGGVAADRGVTMAGPVTALAAFVRREYFGAVAITIAGLRVSMAARVDAVRVVDANHGV